MPDENEVMPKGRRVGLMRTLCLLLGVLVISAASEGDPDPQERRSEYELKAGFMVSFVKFIDWPKSAAAGSQEWVIGVVGRNPFGGHLKKYQGKTLKKGASSRRIRVREFATVRDIQPCHMLFISQSCSANLGDALLTARRNTSVTVSDGSGFAQRGGVIELMVKKRKVRFAINTTSASQVGVAIRSRLLKMAETVFKP